MGRATPYHLLVFRLLFGIGLAGFWATSAFRSPPASSEFFLSLVEPRYWVAFAGTMSLLSLLLAFGVKGRVAAFFLLVGAVLSLPPDVEGVVERAVILFLLVALGFWKPISPKSRAPRKGSVPNYFWGEQAVPYVSLLVALLVVGYHQFGVGDASPLEGFLFAIGSLWLLFLPKKHWAYVLGLANVFWFLRGVPLGWVLLCFGLSHTSHVNWFGGRAGALTVFYDGVCNLCRRSIHFLMNEDVQGRLRYKTLQSETARRQLGLGSGDALSTIVVLDSRGNTCTRLEAVARLGIALGGVWQSSVLLYLLPKSWRRALYDWVAKNRHRWFGKATCVLNDVAHKN